MHQQDIILHSVPQIDILALKQFASQREVFSTAIHMICGKSSA
jgi:hypothetical protein